MGNNGLAKELYLCVQSVISLYSSTWMIMLLGYNEEHTQTNMDSSYR